MVFHNAGDPKLLVTANSFMGFIIFSGFTLAGRVKSIFGRTHVMPIQALSNRFEAILEEYAEIHTPYGATEALPVTSIERKSIIGETWEKGWRRDHFH